MSVHYKFKSALSFDTITFDGLHISIRDLKKAILQQKQIGKASDFDLQITNAQSNEVYEDDNTLVPKNSSLIVVRIPLTTQQKKAWEKSDGLPVLGNKGTGDLQDPYANKLAKTVDLANVEASEADKIQAAITQSTLEYDPSNYLRIKGSNQVGEIPPTYRCFKCNLPGHWIKDCKSSIAPPDSNAADIKKSTGIPQSFMVPVEGPGVPGAMMTPTGHYAVPSIEHQARKEPLRKVTDPLPVEKPSIPDDLICGVCKDLLADAVLIPCCGNSFCDECIRNVLLESEDHQCPDCREKDVSPDTLIPNRFLRNSVNNFRNQTGYCRTSPSFLQSKMAAAAAEAAAATSHPPHPEPAVLVDELNPVQHSQPPPRIPVEPAKDVRPPSRKARHSPDDVQIVSETPPVSVAPISTISVDDPSNIAPPGESPVGQPILNIGATLTKHYDNDDSYHKRGFKTHSFRIRHERSDTPTVDERSHSVEPFQVLPIESIGQPPLGQPPRMFHHSQRPPHSHMYPQGNFMFRPSFPHPPPRHDLSVTYPPGVDHHPPPRMNMNYRGNSYYPPRAPRAPYRPPHAPNGPHTTVNPMDDPLEVFERLLREKDLGRARERGRTLRRRSPSFGRSYSRSPSPRPRSRPPRSRSRSSTRLRSRTPRSRTPPPRSRSRSNIRRRSRSRSFSISSRSRSPIPPRSRSPRSLRSYHSRSPSRDRDRHYSPLPPGPRGGRRDDRRPERSPRHSPVRYYSQRYKDEYGGAVPPKSDRGETRPIERLDRDRERDRGRRFTKPSSVVQEYYSSSQDFNRFVRCPGPMEYSNPRFPKDGFVHRIFTVARRMKHVPDRYETKDLREPRYLERVRERDRDFEKDRERDRDRGTFKRERIPSLLDEPVAAPRRAYDRETYERIASDWEKTRDRELQLQERERERQAGASSTSAPSMSEFYHNEKGSHVKKREPVRPVEPILGVPRTEPPVPLHDDRERDLTYVQARDSPLTEVTITNNNKSPEKEKKSKEKKKKKSKEESDKKKKKKKVKEKTDKKDSSEHEVSSSIPAVEEGEDESKQSEDVPVREDPLYGELATNSDIVDIAVVHSYTKPPGDGAKEAVKEKDVVLAPVPELSKWEKDDEPPSQSEERAQENGSESKQVTSEVIKRAENAIFKKSINPIPEKKSDRRTEVNKSSKEREKPPSKEVHPAPKEVVKEEKVKEEKAVVEPIDKPKEKETVKSSVHADRDFSPRREDRKVDRREERDRRDERDRYRERRDQEREERYRMKVMDRERERERERHSASSRDVERERFALASRSEGFDRTKGSMERKAPETIPLRISAKDRLGAKVEDKVIVKKRIERREVKAEKVTAKRKERLDDREENVYVEKKKQHVDEDRFVTALDKGEIERKKEPVNKDLEVLISQNVPVEPPAVLPKKRSVSLDAERLLVKKIKLAQGEGSTADSSQSSDESVSVKKHKKKRKKKHKKKKKKKKHSSSDSDSTSSSSDSETEKKRKHKKSKKSKKRKKSKK